MHITLTPMRCDTPLEISREGDRLWLNGAMLDLTALPDGESWPGDELACDWLAGDVARIEGALHLRLILPHGPDAPPETLFPARLHLSDDGEVALPPFCSPPVDPGADPDVDTRADHTVFADAAPAPDPRGQGRGRQGRP